MAASSEFVSSSIPSWQISTAHAQPFRGTRDLAFCLKVPLDSLLVWANSEGSGETVRMRRLAWTFAARICDKYQIRLTRSIWCVRSVQFLGVLCLLLLLTSIYVKERLLNAYVILWIYGVVRFNKNTWYGIFGQFLCKIWWRQFSRLTCPSTATQGVIEVSYLKNYCSYCLFICTDEGMKTSLFENEINFKNIQKMRVWLKTSKNFLTVPRILVQNALKRITES